MFLNSKSPKKFSFKMRRPEQRKKPSRDPRGIVAIVFTLVGLVFFSVGIMFVYSDQQFTKASVEAQLTVLLVDRKRSDNGFVYQPTFEARSPLGERVEYVSTFWVSPKPHSVGQVVAGRANWDTGELRSVKMMKSGNLLGTIFAGMGFLLFVFGLSIGIWKLRKRPQTV